MSGNYFEDARIDLQGTARMIIDAVRIEMRAQARNGVGKSEEQQGAECVNHSAAGGGRSAVAQRAIAIVQEHQKQTTGSFTDLCFADGYRTALNAIEGILKSKLK